MKSAFGVDHGWFEVNKAGGRSIMDRLRGRNKTQASSTPAWDPAKAGQHYTPPAAGRQKAPTWDWKPADAKGVAPPKAGTAGTAKTVGRLARMSGGKKAAIAVGAGAAGGGAGGLFAAHRRQ